MAEPEKPFACTIPDCGMTFTNEDHLHVHTKKHDMMLQFGPEQKAAFVADQTPTPTRFIRNCEEVGLFQDLQNVNPFDEGFKRAMETKHGILSLENAMAGSDDLHTPQMVYPLDSGDSTLFSTTNNQRNITISRSSSDESGAIKEFETTTISKLTNEVTTISRIVGKHDDQKNEELHSKDGIRKDSVSYTNNVIKIHSNFEIRKDNVEKNPIQTLISYEDTIIKDSVVTKDVLLSENKLHLPEVPPIMSQKSIDRVVDSLTADFNREDYGRRSLKEEDYEVIIKLPNGKKVRMKAVEDVEKTQNNAKEKLKKALAEKAECKVQRIKSVPNSAVLSNLVPITTGTLIPVTILNQNQLKIPILPLPVKVNKPKKPVKRKKTDTGTSDVPKCSESDSVSVNSSVNSESEVSVIREVKKSLGKQELDSKSAASRRYRARLKETWSRQNDEIRQLKDVNERLREANERLTAEKALLQVLITEHMKQCPKADDLRNIQEKLNHSENS